MTGCTWTATARRVCEHASMLPESQRIFVWSLRTQHSGLPLRELVRLRRLQPVETHQCADDQVYQPEFVLLQRGLSILKRYARVLVFAAIC